MATVIGVGMQMTASAAGMTKGLSEADRALKSLQGVVTATGDSLRQFGDSSSAAAQKQQQFATDVAFLNSALRTGQVTTEQYRQEMAALVGDAQAASKAFQRGLEVTQQYTTAEERRAAQLQEIADLLKQGAISEETAARARAQISGENARLAEAAAKAERDRASLLQEAARVTESVTTEQEKRQAALDRLNALLRDGLISEETYQRAVDRTSGISAAAEEAERNRQALFEEGRRLAESVATVEEKRAAELERINALLLQGVISEETAARAKAEASGANALAAKAEKDRSDAVAAASRIIQANLAPQERYDQQIQELRGHLDAGRLTQEQYNRAAAKARADLQSVSEQADKTGKNIASLASNVRILAGIEIGRLIVDGLQALGGVFTSVTNQITSLVSNVNSSISTLDDLSARTGIGVEQLQKYGFAAKLAGVDTEQFGAAVQKLAVNIGKANPGGELDKSLKRINLSVTELRALAPEQQFSVIGQAISQLPTAADRAAASVAIFGKQGAALAPLFREGAASIEELQARAERLGIIISETQVNNVADMNDAFDTVRATVEGIIGQVIGNLAPAVTAVTEEFLRFVEEWSGSQGQGGTGIANAITDVLLRGAQYFAGVFDGFVSDFGSFLPRIENVSAVFSAVSNTLIALSETFRVIFNVFEGIGNGIALALGKVLEGIGSWVSSDMEAFGRSLQENARAAMAQNSKDLESAATNAANAVVNVFTGSEASPEAAGKGAASKYLRSLEEQIKQARLPEVKLRINLEETQTKLEGFLKSAGDGASDFLKKSQETVRFFRESAEAGNLTAAEIKVMAGFAQKVNDALSKEQAKRDQLLEAAAAQASADGERIANLEKANQAQNKIADDLAAVEREQLRVQQELNAARAAGNQQASDQASARLAQLDQLQASLQEQQQAFEQGFGDGFGKVFEATNKQISDLISKAGEFGTAGAEAAKQFQDGVARVQQQARDGILNAEAYEQEVARQRALFEQQIDVIRKEEQEKLAAAQRVEAFLRQGIDARRQAELDASKQLEERKKQAAQNVAAIQAKIDEQQKLLQDEREKGDLGAARETRDRLRQLRGLQRQEEQIAAGSTKRVQQTFAQAAQQQSGILDSFANAATQQVRTFNNAVADSVGGVNAALASSAEGMRKLFRQQQASLMLGPQQIAVSDVRTAEGQQMILDAAAQVQDPVLIQMRLTNKLLTQNNNALVGNLNRIGLPVVVG